jgi:hypothetical protein
MRFYGRDRYKGVPESDLPDALVEVDRAARKAFLLTSSGFALSIQNCPWCGASIADVAHPLNQLPANS